MLTQLLLFKRLLWLQITWIKLAFFIQKFPIPTYATFKIKENFGFLVRRYRTYTIVLVPVFYGVLIADTHKQNVRIQKKACLSATAITIQCVPKLRWVEINEKKKSNVEFISQRQ